MVRVRAVSRKAGQEASAEIKSDRGTWNDDVNVNLIVAVGRENVDVCDHVHVHVCDSRFGLGLG
jgi:hypothetical protein